MSDALASVFPVLQILLTLATLGAAAVAVLRLRRLDAASERIERLERVLKDELTAARRDSSESARQTREEVAQRVDALRAQIAADAAQLRGEQAQRVDALRLQAAADARQTREQIVADAAQLRGEQAQRLEVLAQRLEALRQTATSDAHLLRDGMDRRLEEMRSTVAEKLESTLERRLGDSFKIVSDRLELVHKGLGEMQTLAIGVGDLKKVMGNVKTRGTWGEVQLGALLEQILAPEQYEANVQTKSSSPGRVEYAVKLPNRDGGGTIWLPIDAKFPLENYLRLVEAQEQADQATVELEGRQLEIFVKAAARDICDKYVNPPETTDFAVMYLPTESLFAEVVKRTALLEQIQRDHRVVVAGPATFGATLNSLQMGFRTLAIQKRSSEVWEILGAVKTEFGKFDEIMKKVQKKLNEAGNVIETVQQKSRTIKKKLRSVQELPIADAARLLGSAGAEGNVPPVDAGDAASAPGEL